MNEAGAATLDFVNKCSSNVYSPGKFSSKYWPFSDICNLHLILTVIRLVTNLDIRNGVLNIYSKNPTLTWAGIA
jgi:hypothetical protein